LIEEKTDIQIFEGPFQTDKKSFEGKSVKINLKIVRQVSTKKMF
jgi:hypothetical protein